MRKNILWVSLPSLALLGSCGGGGVGGSTSIIEFSPNPSVVTSGICTSTAAIISISGKSVSLSALSAVFVDSIQKEARFDMNTNDLAASLNSPELPGHSQVTGSLSFDLAGQGLSLPADGSVVIVGGGTGGTTHFVGTLRCEAGT